MLIEPSLSIDRSPTIRLTDPPGLGIAAFDSLRAEAEPWLLAAFERPPEFELIAGPRSCVIFGEPGSGKSAAYQALCALCTEQAQQPGRLCVEWHPQPFVGSSEPHLFSADKILANIFEASVLSIVRHLLLTPARFWNAPAWVQRNLIWFVRTYLRGDFEMRTGSLQKGAGEDGLRLLNHVATCEVRQLFDEDAEPQVVVAELVKALAEVNLEGVWVLADQFDPWLEFNPGQLIAVLRTFLSTLRLFEQDGFAYKLFLPAAIKPQLSGVGGIERRRVDVHNLYWTPAKLENILIKRISFAANRSIQRLSELCDDEKLPSWLERCGGLTPRGWLEQSRPLMAAFIERSQNGELFPVDAREWRAIRQRHPPLLMLDTEQKLAKIGERLVTLTDDQYKLLAYLYTHNDRICTRSELYYRAYLGLDFEPNFPGEERYEAPEVYRGALETAIWRLRRSIEPDIENELFIITIKRKGYRLEHVYKAFI